MTATGATQVSPAASIFSFVQDDSATAPDTAVPVRCLDCGAVYAKPDGGGSAPRSPGCPECGYAGWVAAAPRVTAEGRLDRPAADRQLHRSARPR